jgi:hypothetical protein
VAAIREHEILGFRGGVWAAGRTYSNASVGGTLTEPCIIYDPTTEYCFIQIASGDFAGTRGVKYPNFPSSPGATKGQPASAVRKSGEYVKN